MIQNLLFYVQDFETQRSACERSLFIGLEIKSGIRFTKIIKWKKSLILKLHKKDVFHS
jgi:hypothetical protein